MNRSDLARYWSDIYEKPYPARLSSFRVEGVAGVGIVETSLDGGVTAICGINGSGKTTIIRAVEAIIKGKIETGDQARLSGLTGRVIVDRIGEPKVREVAVAEGGAKWVPEEFEFPVFLLDVADLVRHIRTDLLARDDLEAAISEGSFQSLKPAELSDLSYLIGRSYSGLEYAELEAHDDIEFPFFRVIAFGQPYDSRRMGQGELAGALLLWHLLKKIPGGSLVILEEPESFLSPLSQRHLLDVLAKYSSERKLAFLVTTHSEPILRRLPDQAIRILRRTQNGVTIREPKFPREYLDIIGMPRQAEVVVFVEDDAALEFSSGWIARHDISLLSRIELVSVGGEAKVTKALALPREVSSVGFVGLYDGDQRGATHTVAWPIAFLPSARSPEGLLRHFVAEHSGAAASALGIPEPTLSELHASISHLNDRDWLIDLSEHLAQERATTIRALAAAWMAHSTNASESQVAYDAFRGAFEAARKPAPAQAPAAP